MINNFPRLRTILLLKIFIKKKLSFSKKNYLEKELVIIFLKNIKKFSYFNFVKFQNFGEVQGRDKSYFIKKANEANVNFEDYTPDGAESKCDIVKRWQTFFEKLCHKTWNENEKDEIDILVVTHGAFMRESIKYLLTNYNCDFPYDMKDLERSAPNSSLTNFFVIMETRPDCDYSICFIKFESFYDRSHLENTTDTKCDL